MLDIEGMQTRGRGPRRATAADRDGIIAVYDRVAPAHPGPGRRCGVASQTGDDTLGERRFAAPQLAFKSQHRTGDKIHR